MTICVATIAMALAAGALDASFDDDFTGATLRVDYYHVGAAAEEHLALDRVRVEGPWPGSKTQLIDATNLGKYLTEVVDLATNRVLYTRGFASIYGEWETTAEAIKGVWRCLPEAVRIPEPHRPFQLRIRKRDANQVFRELWQVTIDPASRFVDRAPLPKLDVWTIQDNGDPAVKVDLLVLGDGYTAEETDKFRSDAKRLSAALLDTEPFASHKRQFNVRAVCPPADHSGVSRPREGIFRDSPLGIRNNTFDLQRYALTLDDRAWRDAAAVAPYDFVLIIFNSRQYGGGGVLQLYASAAAGSTYAAYVIVHEFGHSFAGLGDEYYVSNVAYVETPGEKVEPWSPNITALADPAKLKWRDLVSPDTPVPTPWAKDEYEGRATETQRRRSELRDKKASEEEMEKLFKRDRDESTRSLRAGQYAGKVGAFEGAMYSAKGYYRPTIDCIMFSRNDDEFCPVCTRAIERIIDLYTR